MMTQKKSILAKKSFWILFAVVLSASLMFLLPFEEKTNRGLALLALIAVLWLTEAVHTTITALLVPVGAVFLGLEGTKPALQAFANPTIFLFFGGFAIATALSVQGLDKYIASKVISLAKGNFLVAVLLIFSATAALSMGISNTATTAMMLPLALGMLKNLDFNENKNTYAFVLLGIAYSASIGGMGTLIGSPPNAIVASQMKLSFTDWLQYGTPIMIILMPIMILAMFFVFRPKLNIKIESQTLEENQKLTKNQYFTIIIFALTALCWITGAWINPLITSTLNIPKIDPSDFDSIIAMGSAILICISGLASWKQIQDNTDWGVLMLFGGGLTLSAVLSSSGASKTMVDGIVFLVEGKHFFLIGLFVACFIIFLTEFTSNTASAALLVPIFISIAQELNMNPLGLSMIIGLGASCAFMLPVATPPNAIVYASGKVEQKDMIKIGLVLNIISTIIIAVYGYYFWF